MNERDIKQFFAGASLSEQKKTQLKETLKKRFPQQNGDINTDTFTPQTEPTQPAIVARHKGAKVVAAAAAVALVMSGGIYMTRNIHDYEQAQLHLQTAVYPAIQVHCSCVQQTL